MNQRGILDSSVQECYLGMTVGVQRLDCSSYVIALGLQNCGMMHS